jgi:hypothetical protein
MFNGVTALAAAVPPTYNPNVLAEVSLLTAVIVLIIHDLPPPTVANVATEFPN